MRSAPIPGKLDMVALRAVRAAPGSVRGGCFGLLPSDLFRQPHGPRVERKLITQHVALARELVHVAVDRREGRL